MVVEKRRRRRGRRSTGKEGRGGEECVILGWCLVVSCGASDRGAGV